MRGLRVAALLASVAGCAPVPVQSVAQPVPDGTACFSSDECESGRCADHRCAPAWPFGGEGNLTVAAGQTYVIPAGAQRDWESLEVEQGGALVVSTTAPGARSWAVTVLGVRVRLVLDGELRARGSIARSVASTSEVAFFLPGVDGAPDPLDGVVVPAPYDGKGGDGGDGGGSYSNRTPNGQPVTFPGGHGSKGAFGNGGGGGGGALMFEAKSGADSSSATFEHAGGGSATSPDPDSTAADAAYGDFEGGGARGSHGLPLVLVAREIHVGPTARLQLQGQSGGRGGNGREATVTRGNTAEEESNGAGGGGGGGAGGSGGSLFVRFVVEPDPATRQSLADHTDVSSGKPGKGGLAGVQGNAKGAPASNGTDGEAGHAGRAPVLERRRY